MKLNLKFLKIKNSAFHTKNEATWKKILKLFFHSRTGRLIRNTFNFRKPVFLYDYEKDYLASDLFIWRTDNGLSTIFKSSNILKKFYSSNSKIIIIFYSSNGEFIKQQSYDHSEITFELIIDEKFIGRRGFGTFCVFDFPKYVTNIEFNVTNRCYVGYGRNQSYSMMHGNIIGLMVSSKINPKDLKMSIRPAVSDHIAKFNYFIQVKPSNSHDTKICFSNPLDREISVEVNKKNFSINPRGCVLVNLCETFQLDVIEIKSDFVRARPSIIFDNGKIIDCLHS